MVKKTRIYLDTSVISALFDKRTPERKSLTESAWEIIKENDVYISEIVLEELGAAPKDLRGIYLDAVSDFFILKVTDEVKKLAKTYLIEGLFPEKYFDDALHVAIASINNVEYLISWNFKHLVKVKTRKEVARINKKIGYLPLEIIAPPEL